MYLRVITVAELADENGLRISPERLNGTWRASSDIKWPNQVPPTQEMWDAFRFYLRQSICTRPGRVSKKTAMPLDIPLGRWLQHKRHVKYPFYRTPEWVYFVDEDQLTPNIRRYKQSSNMANSFWEDKTVEQIPRHAYSIRAYIKK